ncbi:hypothetical protein H2203_003351 [Taxawa tesnikishii (nom. ined.)]|nr:hypothetical protein H2203_003351 [Dothideales sp. JES 119]
MARERKVKAAEEPQRSEGTTKPTRDRSQSRARSQSRSARSRSPAKRNPVDSGGVGGFSESPAKRGRPARSQSPAKRNPVVESDAGPSERIRSPTKRGPGRPRKDPESAEERRAKAFEFAAAPRHSHGDSGGLGRIVPGRHPGLRNCADVAEKARARDPAEAAASQSKTRTKQPYPSPSPTATSKGSAKSPPRAKAASSTKSRSKSRVKDVGRPSKKSKPHPDFALPTTDGESATDNSLLKDSFWEPMPRPEIWWRRMPKAFPFGETPFMERYLSAQIDEDLKRGQQQKEGLLQKAGRWVFPESKEPVRHDVPDQWPLPGVTDEAVQKALKEWKAGKAAQRYRSGPWSMESSNADPAVSGIGKRKATGATGASPRKCAHS